MKYLALLLSVILSAGLSAQTLEQRFLIDFGPDDGNNGNATTSPDLNGNHWTNATNSGTSAPAVLLINDQGNSSDYSLSVSSALSTNGINHGGLLAPEESLLGELAIATATQDYFFTANSGAIILQNLNPARAYRFGFFASRNTNEVRVSQYDLTGASTLSGTLQSSGPGLGGGTYNGNNSTLFTTDFVFPDAGGNIRVDLSRASGSFAYINFIELEEYGEVGTVAVTDIVVEGMDITENGVSSQLTATVLPADATVQEVSWSVSDNTVAEITTTGELIPLKNGTVTVSATSLEAGSTVSGSKEINISGQELRHFFVDFGPIDGLTGNPTIGPDTNGNYWNNASDPSLEAALISLQSSEAAPSDYQLGITKALNSGGLAEGGFSQPDPALLGELAVVSATEDYFISPNSARIQFSNLDPDSGYRFRAFGSGISTANSRTRYTVNGFNSDQQTVQTSGVDVGGPGINGNSDQVFRSDIIFPDDAGTITLEVRITMGQFAYLNALRITEYAGFELCPEVDERLIAVMGSSVARGQGAPNDMGYAFQYGELLEERSLNGSGLDWALTNISVGGNNTVAVLDRWSADLAPLCGQYVVYGLSLANEGVLNNGQAAFDQFRDNLEELIARAEARDITPVVMGNYSRAGYGPTEYNFIKQMNLLIHQWDVPSVNVLGANDNGMGNWVSTYQADQGHPNTAGHTEMFYAIVPSLFDALAADKEQPFRVDNTFVALGSSLTTEPLRWVPEETLHSFTVSLDIRTSAGGVLFSLDDGSDNAEVGIDLTDRLYYRATSGELIDGPLLGGEAWHSISLTHYHARGRTLLYLNGELVGEVEEQLAPQSFDVLGEFAPPNCEVRHFYAHRSGMSPEEIAALHGGAMLKSSLEIYSPLDGQGVLGADVIINLAQSTNKLQNDLLNSVAAAPLRNSFRYYPNPVQGQLNVLATDGSAITSIQLFNAQGQLVAEQKDQAQVLTGQLPAGCYWVRVKSESGAGAGFEVVVE
ncbi:MAG: T9SS type A sorting domain-containing protein [Bacteroidota bacterium]